MMVQPSLLLLSCSTLFTSAALACAFTPPRQSTASTLPHRSVRLHASKPDAQDTTPVSRRSAIFTAGTATALLPYLVSSPPVARAAAEAAVDETGDSDSLTTQLFNADGSLIDASAVEEAKSRPVITTFPAGDGDATDKTSLVSVDGGSASETRSSSSNRVTVTYQVPEKWGSPATGYLDKSEGVNAKSADRITVYQLPGPAVVKTLDRASTVGAAKALGIESIPNFNPSLLSADLVSGRRDKRNGNVYYEFDLAVAPASCKSGTAEDLGLGFCPYDSIVLLGATVVGGRMYGIVVECGKEEWKRGSADIKRVRSSFAVEEELEMLDK